MGIIETLRTTGEADKDPRITQLDRLKADYTAFSNHALNNERLASRNTYQLFLDGNVFGIAKDLMDASKDVEIYDRGTNITSPESPLSLTWTVRAGYYLIGCYWLDFSGEYLDHLQLPVLHVSSYSSAEDSPYDEQTGEILPEGRVLAHKETLTPEQVKDKKLFLQRVALAVQSVGGIPESKET